MSNQDVVVTPCVPEGDIESLHDQLRQVDPEYSPATISKEHIEKVPAINTYIEIHALSTPYSFFV